MEAQKKAILKNRENQRNSRARRLAYIQDLEQRVRQYEVDGVRATAEVQAAARKVAEDNALLRSLLGVCGIDNTEIDNYLSNGAKMISKSTPMPTQYMATGLAAEQTKEAATTSQVATPPGSTPNFGRRDRKSPHLTEGTISETGASQYSSPLSQHEPGSAKAVVRPHEAQRFQTLADEQVQGPWRGSDQQQTSIEAQDETSCEVAARIIAGMRGNDDAESVWPELGCSTTQKCTVKNMALFQMMDQ